MKGDQGSLGTLRDQHCWLLCGEMSLSPKDKSTHHLVLESVLDMARATTLLWSRQGRGGDGNYPWSIPPPEHWAEMVSGSGLTLPSAGQQGRTCKGAMLALPARARGPQQSKAPIPSSTGGVWARPLPCWSFAGRDSLGQGQLVGIRQGHYPTA